MPHYKMIVWLESRYNEHSYEDKTAMKRKIRDYVGRLVEENNKTNQHLGLHCKMVDYAVLEVDE